jgi:hypothetical protein
VIAVPLLRLLVSRASDPADSADRDQETSPDESEHPKHCEHTKKRRNGGAGATRIREFSRGQRLSAIGKVDPRRVALSSCSDTWCSRLQCAADVPWSDRQQLGSRLHHRLHHRPRVSASFCEASRDAFPRRATFTLGPQAPQNPLTKDTRTRASGPRRSTASMTPTRKRAQEYGDTTFADTVNKKYPIDTPGRIKAAWAYIHQPSNAEKYTAGEVRTIKARVRRAARAREAALPGPRRICGIDGAGAEEAALTPCLTSPVPHSRSVATPLEQGTPGESRGRKATGPRRPPRRRTVFPPDATKDPTTAELPQGTGHPLVPTLSLRGCGGRAHALAGNPFPRRRRGACASPGCSTH